MLDFKDLLEGPVFPILIGDFFVEISYNFIICEYVVKSTILFVGIVIINVLGFAIFLEVTGTVVNNMVL